MANISYIDVGWKSLAETDTDSEILNHGRKYNIKGGKRKPDNLHSDKWATLD